MTSLRTATPAWVMLVLLATACAPDRTPGGTSVATPGVPLYSVQLAAFSDSSAARRMVDSLVLDGWQAYMKTGGGDSLFRVRVSPSRTADLPARVAHALRSDSVSVFAVQDTANAELLTESVAANRGVHGMSARVRWLVSPNGRAILLVHDPVGVEAEALPDGFVFASESDGVVLQRDSVWDVAPSPRWNRIAYGEAFIINPGDPGNPLSPAALDERWSAVADAAEMPYDSVRANAFMISAMSEIMSYVRPVVLERRGVEGSERDTVWSENPLQVSGGWRIRWSQQDSSSLAIGDAPVRVQDDAPPRNWHMVDLRTASITGTTSQSRIVPPDWRLGPLLDVSVPIDIETTRPMRLEGASIVSGQGWIRRNGRVVGPGVALAATRDGRFIAALAPRPGAREYESPLEAVLYIVDR